MSYWSCTWNIRKVPGRDFQKQRSQQRQPCEVVGCKLRVRLALEPEALPLCKASSEIEEEGIDMDGRMSLCRSLSPLDPWHSF